MREIEIEIEIVSIHEPIESSTNCEHPILGSSPEVKVLTIVTAPELMMIY
jgi:hypothetical protein